MAETMYDSVTASDIHAAYPDARIVGGYVGGRYEWTEEDKALFPTAAIVLCAVASSIDSGSELDIENGDATPADAPGWVRMRVIAGLTKVSLYMNASTWPSVMEAINTAGLQDNVVYRVAKWDNVPAAMSLNGVPAWAKQYADPMTSGGHWDLNYVVDTSWFPEGGIRTGGLGAPPVVAPAPPEVPYPLAPTDWYGVPSSNPHNHSGYFWQADRAGIALIQGRLGGLAVDGRFGPATQAHVFGFQRAHALTVDGEVGPITWGKMFS